MKLSTHKIMAITFVLISDSSNIQFQIAFDQFLLFSFLKFSISSGKYIFPISLFDINSTKELLQVHNKNK